MLKFHIPVAALAVVAFAGATSTSSAACVDQVNASTQGNIILAQSASPGSQRHPAPPAVQEPMREGGSKQHGGSAGSGSGGGTSGSGTSGDSSGSGGGPSGDAGAGAGAGGSESGAGAGGSAGGADSGSGGSGGGGSGGGGGGSGN